MAVVNSDLSVKWVDTAPLPMVKPVGVWNGKLIGLSPSGLNENRLQIFDGESNSTGAAPAANKGTWAWPISGVGVLTQGSSGNGLGFIAEADVDDSTATGVACSFLNRDGTAATYDTVDSYIPNQLVDCGTIIGVGRVLFYLEYTTAANQKAVYYSTDYSQVADWDAGTTDYPVDHLVWNTPTAGAKTLYRAKVTPQTTEPGEDVGWEDEWEERELYSNVEIGVKWVKLFDDTAPAAYLDHWHGGVWCPKLGKQAKAWLPTISYAWGTHVWHGSVLYRQSRISFGVATNIEPGVHASWSSYWTIVTYDGDNVTTSSDPRVYREVGLKDYVDGKLLIFTGDGNTGDSEAMLVCDDVKHLLDYPDTWWTRWGLETDSRASWYDGETPITPTLDGTPDSHYVAGWASQHWRIVGGAYDPVTQEFYWFPDRSYDGGLPCMAVDLSDNNHTSRYLTTEGAGPAGTGWTGLYYQGNALLTVISYPGTWLTNPTQATETIDIWALTADRLNIKRLKRVDRADFYSREGRTSVTAPGYAYKLFGYMGQIVANFGSRGAAIEEDLRGMDLSGGAAEPNAGPIAGLVKTYRNLFFNGDLTAWTTGGSPSGAQPEGLTYYSAGTHTREESSFVPTPLHGRTIKSIKVTMTPQTYSQARFTWPMCQEDMVWGNEADLRAVIENLTEYLRGKVVTLTMSVYMVASGLHASVRPLLLGSVRENGLSSDTYAIGFSQAALGGVGNAITDRWINGSCVFRFPENADLGTSQIYFYANYTNTASLAGVIYLANLGLYEGILTEDDLRVVAGNGQFGIRTGGMM